MLLEELLQPARAVGDFRPGRPSGLAVRRVGEPLHDLVKRDDVKVFHEFPGNLQFALDNEVAPANQFDFGASRFSCFSAITSS